MSKFYGPLNPDTTYHIYSRATGNEKLFVSNENYQFFLDRFDMYIKPVANIYVWSLLPAAFHFMIRIKSEEEVARHCYLMKGGATLGRDHMSHFIMKCFSNFLNSYAKAFNKYYSRKGSLFIDYIRRREVTDEQFKSVVRYIHQAPLHLNFACNIQDWQWSSFNDFRQTYCKVNEREKVFSYFGGYDAFVAYHDKYSFEENPFDL